MTPAVKTRCLSLTLLPLAAAWGCGSAAMTDVIGAKKSSSAQTSQDSQQTATATSTEDEKVDQPTDVSGAFLTCAYLGTTPPAGASRNDAANFIGCAVLDISGKKLDLSQKTLALQLFDDQGTPQTIYSENAPASSDWHIFANLPLPFHQTGSLKVSATGGGQTDTYQVQTKEIKTSPNVALLGGSKTGTATGTGSNAGATAASPATAATPPALALTSVTAQAQWQAGGIGFALGNVDSTSFCLSGSILGAISIGPVANSNIFIGATGGSLLPGSVVGGTTTFTASSGHCFQPFKMLLGSSTAAYAQTGSGCFFLRTEQDYLYIVSSASAAAQGANFTAANLEAFAESLKCP